MNESAENASQAMLEFAAALEAFRKRFHLFVWWFMCLLGRWMK